MKTILSTLLLFVSAVTHAQYYYEDITGTRELGDRIKTYVDNKVNTITATGYDPQGAKTTDFNEWQEIDAANNTLKVATRNGQQVTRRLYQFDKQSRLFSITDSSTDIKSITAYNYDNNNNIISIKTTIEDTLQGLSNTEDHQWQYNPDGKPERMWRILNNTDSTEYRFTIDDKGNVADEQLYRRGVGIDQLYYYYDDNNRLTDIVRYDKKLKKLLPDFMFEYDDNNRVIQKISILSTIHPDYLIWRYLFNEKGLKTKEALFNKNKESRGKIEYTYTFNP